MRSYHQHEHEQAHPRQRRILFGNSDGTSRDYDFWRLSLEKPSCEKDRVSVRDRKQVDPTCDTSDGCILCLKPPPPPTHPQSPRKRNPTERRVVFLTNTSFLSGASSSRFVLMATLSQQCWCFLERNFGNFLLSLKVWRDQ